MPRSNIQLPAYARSFVPHARYKVLYGGRGSSKTWTVAALLVMRGYEQPIRVACMREVQKSIRESSKRALEGWIQRMGLGRHYRVTESAIEGRNGTYFFFRGMSTGTEESVFGLEDVDVVWFEEGQRMSARSREILFPTVRKDNAEIWVTFNPRYRGDPVYRDFVVNAPDNAIVRKINFHDNPWFPKALEEERVRCQVNEPDRYAHVWLGETDDEGEQRLVLPYALIQSCVDAHIELGLTEEDLSGRIDAGLDVADTGVDKNALVLRRGPLVLSAQQWTGQTLGDTTRRAHTACVENGARKLYYDVGGVGGGVRSHLHDIRREMDQRLPYSSSPVLFGGAVTGPDQEYSYEVLNRDYFSRRNAQMAWALKLRAQRTQRLLDGDEAVDPARCLFIDSSSFASRRELDLYLTQLAQPVWEEGRAGKLEVDKQPEEMPSPDLYDATALAFAWDSQDGLYAK